jgi:hypothetical protein
MEVDNVHLALTILQMVITALTAVAASSGFWLYINPKRDNRELSRRLLIGLAHDRIVCLSMTYIERGFITRDEYENLRMFLYEPYLELGANGSAQRLMKEVDNLPLFNEQIHIEKKLKGDKDVSKQQSV